jgi:imidazolonepropionase-like amidohydrolase
MRTGLRAGPAVALAIAATAPLVPAQMPGERGGAGLAFVTAKALVCSWDGDQVLDDAVVLVRDGKIERVGRRAELAIPEGYVVEDVGDRWLMPGILELHCHVGGAITDINDTVYLTQPELRVAATVQPGNPFLLDALAGGVTTVLYIPGSGANCGGRGVLFKTGIDKYEEALVREPGSLKVAQWGNPEGWTIGVGKTFENWNLRRMFREGRAYAERWERHEAEGGEAPAKDIRLEVFRDLFAHRAQVSTHTQVYQVVLTTLTMIRQEFGLDVFIDHGEWDGSRAAALAEELGVPAILGPRVVDWHNPRFESPGWNFSVSNDGRFDGIAAKYQAAGHTQIGFNTDCIGFRGLTPPAEELTLQAALAVRLGFDDSGMQTLRGLTIVAARTMGIDGRLGSLEPGKDADILVVTGHIADPRHSVAEVYIEGRKVYDAERNRRF